MQYSQGAKGCQPTLADVVDNFKTRALRLLWPSTCVLCKQSGQERLDLCQPCEADLPGNDYACAICAEPVPATSTVRICGACLRSSAPFVTSCAPFRYGYPLDHLIRGLKFRGELAYGRVLGELFARRLLATRADALPELIVPVPLAPRRYRERGYNQAIELSLAIGRETCVRVRADVIERQRETLEQTALNQRERRRNVRGAFAVPNQFAARHVAIVDDVITTGSTVREVAKALRRCGAVRIEAWAVAKAGHYANTYSNAMPMKTDMPK